MPSHPKFPSVDASLLSPLAAQPAFPGLSKAGSSRGASCFLGAQLRGQDGAMTAAPPVGGCRPPRGSRRPRKWLQGVLGREGHPPGSREGSSQSHDAGHHCTAHREEVHRNKGERGKLPGEFRKGWGAQGGWGPWEALWSGRLCGVGPVG